MVAPKRGRGAKAKASASETAQATELEENSDNGESVEAAAGGSVDDANDAEESEPEAGASSAPAAEDKVESGKLLVENLPSSLLFEYQDKLKEVFSQYGEVASVKRGPIVVTELTTTPTLSAIVEFKNKDSLEKAVSADGTTLAGGRISVVVQPSTVDTTVLVGVPLEAANEYVRLLFAECGELLQLQEFSKTKYKILRLTYAHKEAMEKALKLDRELRINGFLVTVTKYREDDEQRAFANNKRQQHARQPAPPPPPRVFRGRGGGFVPPTFRGRGVRGYMGRGSALGAGRGMRGAGGGYRGRGAVNFGGRGAFVSRGGMHHQM